MLKKILIITLLVGMLSFAIFTCILGIQVADGLARSNDGNDTKMNSLLQLQSWSYDYVGFEASVHTHPIFLTSTDKVTIPLYDMTWNTLQGEKGVVLLVHGLGGDYKSIYPQAEIYLKNNWKVYALDQRASGQSTSPILSYGYFEKQDLEACVNYIKANHEGPIIVHGVSMGGATAGLYAETQHAQDFVTKIILDSSFTSMARVFSNVWETMDMGIPVDFAIAVSSPILQFKYGFSFQHTDVIDALSMTTLPVLIIASEQDSLSTIDMSYALYHAVSHEEKQLAIFDAKHVEAVIDHPLAYEKAVMSFIEPIQ